MRTIRLAAPFLAIALAALPAVSLHAQQYSPQQGDRDSAHGDSRQWDAPPSEFSDVSRQGFHDGIEAARFDFDNHRGMDPRDSRMFRHPPVPREQRHDYQEGFLRGYDVGMHHAHDGDRDHHDHDGDHHDSPPQPPYGF